MSPQDWRNDVVTVGQTPSFPNRVEADSIQVRLDVWLDLHYRDGRKSKWRSASFADRYETVQAFIEAYGAHQAFRSGGLHPR